MAGDLVTEGQWLVTVAGIAGTFSTKTGGAVSVEHTKDYDGGALNPDAAQGKPQFEDLTVGRGFKNPRDVQLRQSLNAVLAAGRRFQTTITCVPLNEQQVAAGPAEIYTGLLQRVTPAESNAASAQPSRIALVFTVLSAR